TLPLTVSSLMCSQEEQFFINGKLPDFHQVDIPDIWIDSHCDLGYLLYGDFCYKFVTESVSNWNDAETQCQRDQAHLASFHSQEELTRSSEVRRPLFSAAHMPAAAWIGLNDISNENHFVYTDGTPDFVPWAPNQPDNWQDNEDCVQLRGMNHHEPGKLNDDFCTSTKEFICKKGLDGDVRLGVDGWFSFQIHSLECRYVSEQDFFLNV
uniref:C-type lectin domain-containing protein n=1 Tax=Takifugu rubripes TaxID=31033 RepID=A0A674MZJ4_TAKRU